MVVGLPVSIRAFDYDPTSDYQGMSFIGGIMEAYLLFVFGLLITLVVGSGIVYIMEKRQN